MQTPAPIPALEYAHGTPHYRKQEIVAAISAILIHFFFSCGPFIPGAGIVYNLLPPRLYQSNLGHAYLPWACTFLAILCIRARPIAMILPAAAMAVTAVGDAIAMLLVVHAITSKWELNIHATIHDTAYNLPGFICCEVLAYMRTTTRFRRHHKNAH